MVPNHRVFALAFLASLSAACVKKPTVELDHAEITGVRVALPPSVSILLTIYLRVNNPNSYDVAIRAVRGQVLLAYHYTLPVDLRANGDGIWLGANSTTPVAVPVTIPGDLALSLLRETLTTPAIAYEFVGRADVTASRTLELQRDDYSVKESGSVSREQLERSVRIGP
jgi:hypothetical protein